MVLKASGLAAGKGVLLPRTKAEAHEGLRNIMLDKVFGSAGDEVVIEEYLEGQELSILTFVDKYTCRSLPPAQDHKQVYDGDQGPNTGGMGCFAPPPIATKEILEEIHRTVIQPSVDGMRKERIPFVGCLFTGYMITKDGPRLLEYNVRFGDPETQTCLPLLNTDTDLADVLIACCDGCLDGVNYKIDESRCSTTVVATAHGYPDKYEKGYPISLEPPPRDTQIFHAGTKLSHDAASTSPSSLLSNGGRVIAATSTASSLFDAIALAYAAMSSIKFLKMHYRRDIGHKALKDYDSTATSSTSTHQPKPLTYASAGVSISAGNELVDRIKPFVRSTARPGADAHLGGFGGLLDLKELGYRDAPIIVQCIDGVGTKLELAHTMKKHDTIGQDNVAMNVNDLIVQGAIPRTFLDCYTTSKLDVDIATDVIRGIADGCREAGCTLSGGETAEMPGLLRVQDGGFYDINGTALGEIPPGRRILPDKQAMREGDVLIGLASSGVHSNGFSLVRKILERAQVKLTDQAPWSSEDISTGSSLLTPTRIYVKSLLPLIAENDLIKGMAHITGGGLIENVPRMLPDHLAARIDTTTWQIPPVLKWLKKAGSLEDIEFAGTFNAGLGMVLVVPAEQADHILVKLGELGEQASRIGHLIAREGSKGCVLENMETWKE